MIALFLACLAQWLVELNETVVDYLAAGLSFLARRRLALAGCIAATSIVALAQTTVVGRSTGPIRVVPPPSTYQCTGTGCVARPTAQKEGDFVSVEDFGADPTGAADSTTPIQNALNFAYSTKTALYFHQGAYRITAPITLTGSGPAGNTRGLMMVGDAPAARMDRLSFVPKTGFSVIDASGVALGSWPAGRSMFEFTNLHSVTLRNLWFLGNGAQGRNDQTATTNGVEFIGLTTGHVIDGCTFQQHRRGLNLGLTGGPVGWATIINNMFTANWFMGAYQNGGDTQWIGNFFNESSPVDQSPTDTIGVGLFMDQAKSNSVIGGKVEWNSKGIQLNNSSDIVITGVMTDKNTFSIVSTNNSSTNQWAGKGITVSGNKFLGTGGSMLSGSMHIYVNNTNSPKLTMNVTGNVFCKGSSDAYCENDGTYSGLSTPSITVHTNTTGSLAAGTYYYRVSAESALGQTVGSAEVSNTLGAPGGVALTWTVSSGTQTLTNYRVYRGSATGMEQELTRPAAGTTTYTDTGAITPAGDTPPTVTPDDIINVVGATATTHVTFSGNSLEGAAGRSWLYQEGANGSRLQAFGNTGAFVPTPTSTVAYLGDIPLYTVPPSTATWRVGDIVWNKTPAAAGLGPIGWVNIVAGTPGTWNSFGPVAPALVALTAGTATTPVFSGCRPVCTNTSNANAIKCAVVGTTLTLTGTGTDTISVACY